MRARIDLQPPATPDRAGPWDGVRATVTTPAGAARFVGRALPLIALAGLVWWIGLFYLAFRLWR